MGWRWSPTPPPPRLTGSARRYAWSVVVLAAGLSGLAQATYLAGALPPPGTNQPAHIAATPAPAVLRAGVGAWPAVAAAIAAHLLFLIGTTRTRVDSHASTPGGSDPTEAARSHGNGRASWDSTGCPAADVPPVPSHIDQRPAGLAVAGSGDRSALPAGLDVGRAPGMRRALSQADRARTVATLHAARTGALPTVRELAELASVGRGTADRALTALRAASNGLHVVTNTPDENSHQ